MSSVFFKKKTHTTNSLFINAIIKYTNLLLIAFPYFLADITYTY
jgi:hypothetical protein